MYFLLTKWCAKLLILCLMCTLALPTQAASLIELTTNLKVLQTALQNYQATVLGSGPVGVLMAATTIVVVNDAELANAIKGVTGGETIQLAPGTYGALQIIGGTYNQLLVGAIKISTGVPTLTAPVTIQSQDMKNPAVIKSVTVRSSNHWHFKGLAIRPVKSGLPAAAVSFSGEDCSIEDSDISYGDASRWTVADWLAFSGNGISLGGANNIAHNNLIRNIYMGIEVRNTAVGSIVTRNTIDGIGGDGVRLLADNTMVDSNLFKNFKEIDDNHDDCAQSWGTVGNGVSQEGIVRNITFQNNICINNENPNDPLYDNAQGFDAFDGSMQDWVVQNNVYVSTAYWGVFYSGAVNMKIRNNTIIDSDAVVAGADTVRIAVGANKTGTIQPTGNVFENNISNLFTKYGSSSTVVSNQVVKMADYDKYFRDWRHGDVRLLETSPIQGIGANLDPATVGSNVVLVSSIQPVPAQAPTLNFSATPLSVQIGSNTTFTWTSTEATQCIATGDWTGNKTTAGTHESGVLNTLGVKNYTLSCTGAGGSVTKHISVTLTAVPVTGTSSINGESSHAESSSGGGNSSTISHSTTSTIPATSINPNQARIDQLLQILALLQKLLSLILAQRH